MKSSKNIQTMNCSSMMMNIIDNDNANVNANVNANA